MALPRTGARDALFSRKKFVARMRIIPCCGFAQGVERPFRGAGYVPDALLERHAWLAAAGRSSSTLCAVSYKVQRLARSTPTPMSFDARHDAGLRQAQTGSGRWPPKKTPTWTGLQIGALYYSQTE